MSGTTPDSVSYPPQDYGVLGVDEDLIDVDAGANIVSAEVTSGGVLVITTASGAVYNAGSVVGPTGADGEAGPAGAAGPSGAAGPAGAVGPVASVGTPLGIWNASTNTPTLSNGSGTQGDSYIVSVAGSTSLDGESGWTVGDVAVRGAATWARVPGSDGVGAFTQISIGDTVTTADDVTGGGLVIADPYGEVIMSIVDDEISMPGLVVGANGPVFDELTVTDATATNATVTDLTATEATIAEVALGSGDGGDGLIVTDGYGEVLMQVDGDGVALPGVAASQNDGTVGADFVDVYGEVALRIGPTGSVEFGGLAFTTPESDDLSIAFADPYGEIFAGFDGNGAGQGFGEGGSSVTTSTEHSQAEIDARDGVNKAEAAAMAVQQVTSIQRPIYELNHFILYGQSLSIGSEGAPVLSTTPKYDNLMFGGGVRDTSPNVVVSTWAPIGSAGFNALNATGDAEVVLHGGLNTYRRMHLASMGLTADASRRCVASSCGIGGISIAQASPGATPTEVYNRVVSCMDQTHTQATTDTLTYGVTAMLWLQGESGQTETYAYTLPLLRALYTEFAADAIAETGQPEPPAFFLYQTAAPNTNFDGVSLGKQVAQLDFAMDDGVFMVGPNYPYPDSNNLHLVANGYRWLGSQFGKVMHRVLTLGHRWKPLHMLRATIRGREILVDCFVPYPPLVFDDPYLQTGWTTASVTTGGANSTLTQADKGFSVISTTSVVAAIETVELVSDTQIKITMFDTPSPSLTWTVRVADGVHNGHANVRDSDPALADDIYLDGQPGQVAGEANATLSGERYPLWNWIVAQQITVEVLQ